MAEIRIVHLTGRMLPADSTLLRDHIRAPERRDHEYNTRYDRHTLFYDVVRLSKGRLLMTAPRLLNLWEPLRAGLRAGGRPLKLLRRRVFGKGELIEWRDPGTEIVLEIDGQRMPVEVRGSEAARFAGLNAVTTMNKDNDLGWVRDWAAYYARVHGLTGVALIDNGSTEYTPEALGAAMADVPGLKQVLIASAPFPYGLGGGGKGSEIRGKFLQFAMLNLARREMLSRARAVLNVDIDEIVTPMPGDTVFDRACRAPLGLARLGGTWVYPAPGAEMPCAQSAHTWRAEPPEPAISKWCIRADSLLGPLSGWNVHKVGGDLYKLYSRIPEARFLHCRGTSTGWKSRSYRFAIPEGVIDDPELREFWSRDFTG